MARPDEVLPGLGQRTLVPRLLNGPALSQLNLSPNEGYVLSRIDGRTTLWEICLLVPLRREETLRILRRLRAEGIIDIPGSLEPAPSKESMELYEPPKAPPAPPPQRPDAAAMLAEELQLLLNEPVAAAGRGAAHPAPPGDEPPLLLLDPEPAPAPGPPGPGGPGVSSPLPAGTSAPAAAASPAPAPTPAPSLRSSLSSRSPLTARPASDRPSRDGVSPAADSASSPDLRELSLFERREPGRIDDTRPSRRTDPPRTSQGSRQSGSRAAAGAASSPRPAPTPSPVETPSPSAAAASGDVCDLTPEQRRRIDEIHAQIATADAFTLLGVGPEDDRKAIQRAYFKLSKEFHPDRFFKKQLGPYRQRVAAVFQALTEARDILVDDERRRRYLAGEPTS